ncbi:MAG: ABC transporter substrate-binding protein, partial [Macromonas sp.]
AIIQAAAAQASTNLLSKYDARNPAALKQLVGTGTKLRPFSQEIMAAAFKSAQQVYADLNNTNPEWKKIYTDYAKFLADQNSWFRYTEGTYDRFMQAQKL